MRDNDDVGIVGSATRVDGRQRILCPHTRIGLVVVDRQVGGCHRVSVGLQVNSHEIPASAPVHTSVQQREGGHQTTSYTS